jgi:hypothetical protein
MDHAYINQFDIVDQYVMGKLAAEERILFEEHFVDCPQCVARLKITRNFIQDLRLSTVQQALQTESYAPGKVLSQMLSFKSLALACSCLLIIATAGMLLIINYIQGLQSDINQAKKDVAQWQRSYEEEKEAADRKHQEAEQELTQQISDLKVKLQNEQERRPDTAAESNVWIQPEINVPLFALNSVRGGEQNPINEIKLPHSHSGFLISLGLGNEGKYKDYKIMILDNNNRQIVKKSGGRPDLYNALSIGLNSKLFRPGNYTLKLNGVTKDGGSIFIGNYPFRVIKSR